MNAQGKYTPGPWEIIGDDEVVPGIPCIDISAGAGSSFKTICLVQPTLKAGEDFVISETDRANASLIIAAPDLLKALEAARGYIQGKFTNVPRPLRGKSREDELLRMIDAEIGKAKGGAS